ncbi:hypothetical protein ABMA27_012787 [Loxostege sticticalis]|uniref:C2H2-type domain-containing protein n=1 Tax=Loxostege sticticalis TaxID=481309 RepID=A0ABR3GZT4_LOXSC
MSVLKSLLSERNDANQKKFNRDGVVAFIHGANVCPFKYYRFFICIYCSERFILMPDLVKHHKHEHRYVTKAETMRAVRRIGAGEPVKVNMLDYNCKICKDTISDFEHLKHHLISKHKLPIDFENDMIWPFKITAHEFGCPMCGILLEQYGQLSKHINEHFDNFICTQCGARFATEFRLRRHGSSHEDGAYPCDRCDKLFKTTESRLNHFQRIHMKVKKNKCMYCEESFGDYTQKLVHLHVVHGLKRKEYKCSFCPKVFKKSSVLRSHERSVHIQLDKFICDFCGYTCYDKKHMVDHMIRHTGVRKYICQVCGKGYARAYTLTEHMRIHNNERRFSCQYCEQAFVQKCSLKLHMKNHHKEFLMYE